jgi:ElaB/YqjD/DUF883 family membrane-anchored ribosome-binding protein
MANNMTGMRKEDTRTGSTGTTGGTGHMAGGAATSGGTTGGTQGAATAVMDKARDVASNVVDRAKDMASTAADTARDWASTAGDKAGEALGSLAGTVRENVPGGEQVAEAIEGGTRYFQEHSFREMADDVAGVIRRNPIPAVLVGVGIGFLLARATSPRS